MESKKKKGTEGSFQRMTSYLLNFVKPVNDSKLFAGLIIITLNIGSRYVNMNLPKPIESYLKYTFSRNILVFAICWMGTKEVLNVSSELWRHMTMFTMEGWSTNLDGWNG